MSTDDWFSLRPLNTTNYQPQIDDLNARVSSLETSLTSLNQRAENMTIQIKYLQDQATMIGDAVDQMRTQLTELNNTIYSLSTSINNIVDQYKPIAWFDFPHVNFTDYAGNSSDGRLHGAWYRPIKLLQGHSHNGVDLKFLLLVFSRIYISNIPNNGRFFFSDQLPLLISFVNKNHRRVFWDSAGVNAEIRTRQAEYDIINVPINW
jgi:hypothetical protein